MQKANGEQVRTETKPAAERDWTDFFNGSDQVSDDFERPDQGEQAERESLDSQDD